MSTQPVETPPSPDLRQRILGWIVPLLILGAAIAAFLGMGSQPPPERKSAEPPAAVPVRTAEVRRETGGLEIKADGVVVPLREVTLAAEVPGRVRRKTEACKAGQYVAKGDVLLEIDPRDYELDVARLERELTQSGLAIEELDAEVAQNAESTGLAERQVALAHREVVRIDGLKANKVVTESEHERALREELTAANTLASLQGQRRILEKRRNRLVEGQALAATMLERARLDLARTTIVAPADGVVVDDKVEQDSFVAKGTPLVTIEDTTAAEVKTSLEMNEVARIWGGKRAAGEAASQGAHDFPDTPATVVFTLGDRSYQWEGLLSRQEGRGLDEKTRTLPCRVLVRDPSAVKALDRYGAPLPQLPPEAPRSLLRGMFVQVRMHVEPSGELVSIPEQAQRPSGDVWLVRDGRLVIERPHAVLVVDGRAIYDADTAGLLPDDRVVVSQIANPRDGMTVADEGERLRDPVKTADAKELP
jgi:multidrug efflux pump subunit AcrA (membrane-fusion protein)